MVARWKGFGELKKILDRKVANVRWHFASRTYGLAPKLGVMCLSEQAFKEVVWSLNYRLDYSG